MIKAAIAGATGYTAGELLRILVNHPEVEVVAALSTSSAGAAVSDVHRDLLGDSELRFSEGLIPKQAAELDVMFLALGHGLSRSYLDALQLPDRCRVIDLGNDFRLDPYHNGHEFVYGLSEVNREAIVGAHCIANPGCFATSILLPLVPLAMRDELTQDVHIHAITGSTGAGKSLSESTHFSYRTANISVYKPFTHQHLGEIGRTLAAILGSADEGANNTGSATDGVTQLPPINFVPIRGDFARGIFASIYLRCDASAEELTLYYKEFYRASPFVRISDAPISMKEVVNTNKCLIHIEKHGDMVHLTSAIDNLIKGASGQAVQNMNLMMGLDEACGLRLKGSAF